MGIFFFRVAICCLCFVLSPVLHAEEIKGFFIPNPYSQTSQQKISNLVWKRLTDIPIVMDIVEGKQETFAIIDGKYEGKDRPLILGTRPIKRTASGLFRLRIPVRSKLLEFDIVAIDQFGKVERERFFISFPTWKPPSLRKRYAIVPSLGLTQISYQETGKSDLSETAITAKISVAYDIIPRKWDLAIAGYYTLLPLVTNQSGISARFLGLNFRAGYSVPFVRAPWQLTLMTGVYYTTTIVTNNSFGFQDLMGPQFFPVLRGRVANADSVLGYFKFSPVGAGFALTSLSNREIAFGVGWSHLFRNARSITVSVDWANLSLLIDDTTIQSTSLSLSVGYSF